MSSPPYWRLSGDGSALECTVYTGWRALLYTTTQKLIYFHTCFQQKTFITRLSYAGADPGEAIAPPKTYKSNFIHHEFVQFGKQHSRYKVILPSNVLSQQCCEVGEGTVGLGSQLSFLIYSKSWKRWTLKFPWWFSLIPAVVLKWIFPW